MFIYAVLRLYLPQRKVVIWSKCCIAFNARRLKLCHKTNNKDQLNSKHIYINRLCMYLTNIYLSYMKCTSSGRTGGYPE